MIGEFDEIIELYKPVYSKTATGQPTKTYNFDFKALANIEIEGNDEFSDRIAADEKQITATTHFVKYIPNNYQIVYNGETYEVKKVKRIEKRKYIKIQAKKKIV